MFELWARKRVIDGRGYPYEFICWFNNIEQSFYMIDQLDRELYQECLVLKDNSVILYREFPKNKAKRRKK